MDRADKDSRRDTHLLRISKMFAEFSTCLSRKVGCVIASDAGHVISTGYNGAPKRTRHSCEAGCFCQFLDLPAFLVLRKILGDF